MLRTGTRVRLADTSRGVFRGIVLMGSYPDGSCYVRWDTGINERLPTSELLVDAEGAPPEESDPVADHMAIQVGPGSRWKPDTIEAEDEAAGEPRDDEGYEPDDPKHPTFRERLSAVWDMRPGK